MCSKKEMEMLTFKQFIEKHCWKGYVKHGMKKKGDHMVNNCMKAEDEERPILRVVEPIDIKGIGIVDAKIDSGNEAYNVFLGVNIKHHDNGTCTFTTVNNKQLTLPCDGSIDINIGSGNIENRPTVRLSFVLKGKHYNNIVFSLADRSQNDQPVLIGEPFVKQINALIDVNRD